MKELTKVNISGFGVVKISNEEYKGRHFSESGCIYKHEENQWLVYYCSFGCKYIFYKAFDTLESAVMCGENLT